MEARNCKPFKKTLRILITAFMCILFLSGCNLQDYKEANTLFESGKYGEALRIYENLGEYKDSSAQVLECKYLLADSIYTCGDFSAAIAAYDELGNYKDSAEKATASRYEYACSLLSTGKYSAALDLFSVIDTYKDSNENATLCKREIGMREMADYDFLDAVVKSVQNRIALEETGHSRRELVTAELSQLESFFSKEFYDNELYWMMRQYRDGLYQQNEALSKQYCNYQISWQEGLIERWDALSQMHNKYGIFNDNPDLLAEYVYGLDYQRSYLEALNAISADIVDQMDGISFDFDDVYTATTVYQNNTKYNFDIQFYITWYSEDRVRIDSSTEFFGNIEKGSTNKLSFYFPWDKYEKLDGGYSFSAEIEIWPIL